MLYHYIDLSIIEWGTRAVSYFISLRIEIWFLLFCFACFYLWFYTGFDRIFVFWNLLRSYGLVCGIRLINTKKHFNYLLSKKKLSIEKVYRKLVTKWSPLVHSSLIESIGCKHIQLCVWRCWVVCDWGRQRKYDWVHLEGVIPVPSL